MRFTLVLLLLFGAAAAHNQACPLNNGQLGQCQPSEVSQYCNSVLGNGQPSTVTTTVNLGQAVTVTTTVGMGQAVTVTSTVTSTLSLPAITVFSTVYSTVYTVIPNGPQTPPSGSSNQQTIPPKVSTVSSTSVPYPLRNMTSPSSGGIASSGLPSPNSSLSQSITNPASNMTTSSLSQANSTGSPTASASNSTSTPYYPANSITSSGYVASTGSTVSTTPSMMNSTYSQPTMTTSSSSSSLSSSSSYSPSSSSSSSSSSTSTPTSISTSSSSTLPACTNAVTNGDFETGSLAPFTYLSNTGATVAVGSPGYNSANSLQITLPFTEGITSADVSQDVQTIPGATYDISLYAKVSSTEPAQLYCDLSNAASGSAISQNFYNVPAGTWIHLTTTVTTVALEPDDSDSDDDSDGEDDSGDDDDDDSDDDEPVTFYCAASTDFQNAVTVYIDDIAVVPEAASTDPVTGDTTSVCVPPASSSDSDSPTAPDRRLRRRRRRRSHRRS